MTEFHKAAEDQGIPLRTLEQVKAELKRAAAKGGDLAAAWLMLRHGRLTEDAREYVARKYPQ